MNDWEKEFPVARISRYSLTSFGYTQHEIETMFSDDVMEQIASKMRKLYALSVYIPHVRQSIAEVLSDTRKTNVDQYGKSYTVLSFNRISLQCVGVPPEVTGSLTEEDLETMCHFLINWYAKPSDFTEVLRHTVNAYLTGKGWEWGYDEELEAFHITRRPGGYEENS